MTAPICPYCKRPLDPVLPQMPDETKISALNLPARVRNLLQNEGIESLSQLRKLTFMDLLRIPGCGRKSIELIQSLQTDPDT
jgi:DNA-directed RNA polymerase alpha subunit